MTYDFCGSLSMAYERLIRPTLLVLNVTISGKRRRGQIRTPVINALVDIDDCFMLNLNLCNYLFICLTDMILENLSWFLLTCRESYSRDESNTFLLYLHEFSTVSFSSPFTGTNKSWNDYGNKWILRGTLEWILKWSINVYFNVKSKYGHKTDIFTKVAL